MTGTGLDSGRISGEAIRRNIANHGPSAKPLCSRSSAAPHHPNDRADRCENTASASLDQAQRRADEARYQEVTCRSALNPVKGMPFNWTLNPYRGCTHGCHYCFARRYQTQFELGPDDEFSSLIFVKVNFVEVLARELDKPSWTRELAALGTATDPYQPIEGHYKLTRGVLEALRRRPDPVGIVTKGPMVVRDSDVLADLSRGGRVHGLRQRADRRRRRVARRWSRAPRTRCSGCAPSAGCATPGSTPAS